MDGQPDPNARLSRGRLGVVHSFTGTAEEMKELVRRIQAGVTSADVVHIAVLWVVHWRQRLLAKDRGELASGLADSTIASYAGNR